MPKPSGPTGAFVWLVATCAAWAQSPPGAETLLPAPLPVAPAPANLPDTHRCGHGCSCTEHLLAPYQMRAHELGAPRAAILNEGDDEGLPEFLQPWWQAHVTEPLGPAEKSLPTTAEELVMEALRHAAQVRVISDIPEIRRTGIVEAAAEFDVTAFVESRWADTSEPVGSFLQTGGGATRFRDHQFTYQAGVRKRNHWGGRVELSQQFGTQENNSNFFIPNRQGNARLSLSFTQPILNGAGRAYNTSSILLAEIDTSAAVDELSGQLQDYLLEVHRGYWMLYRDRAALMQRQKLYERGKRILAELENRRNVDALKSQILQAHARVARRYTGIVETEAAVRNAEAQIRSLVNAPHFTNGEPLEIVPREEPGRAPLEVQLTDVLTTALQYRPAIAQEIKAIRSAAVKANIAQHEMLPRLDLILETYVAGLAAEYDVGDAWANQFQVGEPGYTVGLMFEVPLGQRAARARKHRADVELRQLSNQFQASVERLMAEAEVAVRKVKTSYRTMTTTYRTMLAAETELRYLQERWRLLPGDRDVTSVALENLLESQERLAEAEFGFTAAQVEYNLATIELKRVQGTLFSVQ